ncbi:MAG: hypothetical protein AAF585_10455, partial [Verrucomicrobiota bacterium]
MSEKAKDRSHWIGVKCRSFDEMRILRIRQWQEVSCGERLEAAWELSKHAWKGNRDSNDEFRLQRSV